MLEARKYKWKKSCLPKGKEAFKFNGVTSNQRVTESTLNDLSQINILRIKVSRKKSSYNVFNTLNLKGYES